jgi:hypothetical protein
MIKVIIGHCDSCKKELIYKSSYYLLWHPLTNEDKRFCSIECIKKWIDGLLQGKSIFKGENQTSPVKLIKD